MKNDPIELLRHHSRKLIRELGMLELDNANPQETPGHWHALIEIAKDPGITISKLGHLLLISTSRMSRLIKALAKDGLIEFKLGNDKREKYLCLTDKGKTEIEKIDSFSQNKIVGAFDFLNQNDIHQIIESICKYADALEKSRMMAEQVKIATLPTSRSIRKQIMNMIAIIQKSEFNVPITNETNISVLKAEDHFYFHNSYNFWYATNDEGKIIGSIGLKKLDDQYCEIKKCFVIQSYRGKGVAQKLMETLLKAALKHQFEYILLGSFHNLHGAHKFYRKYGFKDIKIKELPKSFKACHLDTVFLLAKMSELFNIKSAKHA
jgi:DNA-binding MarR family transcriptional regulator/ribosomal protein S18 acetylase RimI-like enzyme